MQRTYPDGVPSWIDLQQPDVGAAIAFYSSLLGREVGDAPPPDVPFRYAVASLHDDAVVDPQGAARTMSRSVPPGDRTT